LAALEGAAGGFVKNKTIRGREESEGGGGIAYGKRVAAEPIAPGACMEYPLQ